ncbi:MAG: DUF3325 domain-containing protein [Duganella sp.]
MNTIANGLLMYAALAGALAGFAGLSLAMDRHWQALYGRGTAPGDKTRWLQGAGVAGLLLSLAASLALKGAMQGWVMWLGALTVGALAVVLTLTYRAPRIIALARVAGISAIVAALAGLAL